MQSLCWISAGFLTKTPHYSVTDLRRRAHISPFSKGVNSLEPEIFPTAATTAKLFLCVEIPLDGSTPAIKSYCLELILRKRLNKTENDQALRTSDSLQWNPSRQFSFHCTFTR